MQQPALKKRLNNLLFTILVFVILILIAEMTSVGALWFLKKWKGIEYTPLPEARLSHDQNDIVQRLLQGEEGYIKYHSQLGWVPNPQSQKQGFQSNALGFRATRKQVSSIPDPQTVRIATFGDSFTFGHGVTNADTWQSHLEKIHPQWEMLNFGVSGYGQDQAYLRYKLQGRKYQPRIVVFGFNSENIFRNLNVFRPFYSPKTEFPLTKPRFLEKEGKLVALENPFSNLADYQKLLGRPRETIQRLGMHDYYYHQLYRSGQWDGFALVRYLKLIGYQMSDAHHPDLLFLKDNLINTKSEGYRVATALIDQFVADIKKEGAIPVILILPTRKDLSRMAGGQPKQYIRFVEHWSQKNYHVIDFNEVMTQERINVNDPRYYTEDGHNSGLMHKLMAPHLQQFLVQQVLANHEK